MKAEQPITRAVAASFIAQVEDAIAAGRSVAEVQLAGQPLTFARAADGQITVRAAGQSQGMRVFAGAAAVPPGYPDDLPFHPNETVTASITHRSSTLMWWAPADPAGVVAALDEQCSVGGWIMRGEVQHPESSAMQRSYTRGEAERMVLLSTSGIVSLFSARTTHCVKRPRSRAGVVLTGRASSHRAYRDCTQRGMRRPAVERRPGGGGRS
jgi:hypothetical protein